MRIKTFLSIAFLIWTSTAQAQNHDTNSFAERNIEELGLFAGYNFNAGSERRNLHILELGIKRTFQISPIEPFCKSIYFSNEILFTDNKLMIGPKIGAYISAMLITLGIESIYYTDFMGQSVRLSLYIGLGGNRARLTVNFPINLYKKDFDYINPVTLHFSFQYLILWSKKYGEADGNNY